jgi:glycosyltransferase involved in cell wall biosynthesis
MRNVFLFLSTDSIGGAEKRFFGLWKAIAEAKQDVCCTLVLSPKLYRALQLQENSYRSLQKYANLVIQQELSGDFKKFRFAVQSFVTNHTSPNDILHFVGDHPLLHFSKRKQAFSITQSSLKNLNLAGKLGQVAGVYHADIVDVLDPRIYSLLRRLLFYKRNKIFQTSNSFFDSALFYSLPFSEKRNWLVFLGRFEAMKQVSQLLEAIPALQQELKGKDDLHFYFFGHGSLESEMRKIVAGERFRTIPITISYNKNPAEVLAKSKVFFSLQLHNNYPSKSLIEAMAAGNIPLVTDVGQSRWLAKPEFSYYVPEHFTKEDLVLVVRKIFAEAEEVLAFKSREARQFVLNEHTIEKMRDYYLWLYKQTS